MGADTVARIGHSRYYDNSQIERDAAIASIQDSGCRFLVFGRLADGNYETLGDLELPQSLYEMCVGVDERAFRVDVSSTQLRGD